MFTESLLGRLVPCAGSVVAAALALAGCGSASPSSPGAGGMGGEGGRNDGSADTGGTSGTQVGSDAGECAEPPPANELIGWATTNGGTTGGGSAAPVTVTTLAALNAAASGMAPGVIYVRGVLESGTAVIGSNKTIAGLCGAEIHGHIQLPGSVNVILRNIKIVGNNCTEAAAMAAHQCSAGLDAVTVINNAHNLWFDHLDVSDGSDGNLDITNGSDFVTVSWTKFSYSTARADLPGNNDQAPESGHRFSNLIGASDTTLTDMGKLNVTWHHDWWADNIDQRMPRTRFGKIHLFNNLFTAAGNSYCTNAGLMASVLVENSVYDGVNDPLAPDANGDMLARDNLFPNSTGTMSATGMGFVPPYSYDLDGTADLEATIRGGAGPH